MSGKSTVTGRLRGAGAWVLLGALLGSYGCSRPEVIPIDRGISQTQSHDAPFQSDANEAATDVAASSGALARTKPVATENDAPGNPLQDLPSGTLLTVQLKRAVYASVSPSEAWFEAVVVEPVIVDGNTLIPSGTNAAGRVESARTSNLKPNRGYVRLALQSVQLGEHRVPVQTASLFAREAPLGNNPISIIHLEKGRRLTFRVADTAFPTQIAH